MKNPKVESETLVEYKVDLNGDDQIIEQALGILHRRMKKFGDSMNSPTVVRNYLSLKLAELEHEVFACIFLNTQNQIIAYEEMFRGTVSQTSVYPREVVKRSVALNASGVIFAHNHPSGVTEPSQADHSLTSQLKTALGFVDVKVLDHIIVAGVSTLSFAERGWV